MMKQRFYALLLAGGFSFLAILAACGPTTPASGGKDPSPKPSPSSTATPGPATTPNPADDAALASCKAALMCVSEKTSGQTSTDAKDHLAKLDSYSSEQRAGVCRSYGATAGLLGCR